MPFSGMIPAMMLFPSVFMSLFSPLPRALRPLLILTLIYAGVSIIVAKSFHAPWEEILALALFSTLSCFQLLVFFCIGQAVIAATKTKTANPFALLKSIDKSLSEGVQNGTLKRGAVIMIILYPLFFGFSALKSLIPLIHPYGLDPLFADWDKAFHGGIYPHQILGDIIYTAPVIHAAEYIYYAWFLVLIAANGYALFYDRNEPRRARYIWASVLTWIVIGSLAATLLSSVGPIFYGEFYSGLNPYADIWGHFQSAESSGAIFWSEGVRILLDITRNETICDLNGISAMPSMHVGTSFLITLYAASLHRGLGIAAGIFTLLIFISSLILGLHYAIDGYFSCVGTGIIWIVSKKLSTQKQHTV